MSTEPKIDPNFDLIYEDDSIIIISKSGNCPTHEGGLYKENCLTSILEKKYGVRLYPVYRLDRETSGLVVFSKKSKVVKNIFDSIKEKEYIAVCKGNFSKEKKINEAIGETKGDYIKWKKCIDKNGKKSITNLIPVKNFKNFCIIKAIPLTGRQHQIRVHLNYNKTPLIGDKLYGESDKLFWDYIQGKEDKNQLIDRQALHCAKIIIKNKEFLAKLPNDMLSLIEKIKSN